MKSLKEFVLSEKYILAAHRGSSGTAPENTLAAFREALDAGVTLIEADIRFTADDQIVAFHDDFVNGNVNLRTSDLTLDEIRHLDLSVKFGDEFKGERAPLLSEIVNLIAGKAYLIIEIKALELYSDKKLKSIINEINNYNYLDKTLFASFNFELLKRLKELEPAAHIVAIKRPGDERLPSEIKKTLNIDGFICAKEEINDTIFYDTKANEITSAVYSLDNDEDLELLDKYPFKIIVTNYPQRIKELLAKRGIFIEPVY